MAQSKLNLNSNNYYSLEADRQYMSVSQFKKFEECEAKTMAVLKGEYKDPPNKAMIVGSYVHAAFESDETFSGFIEENNSVIFNTRGNKYADFKKADEMIDTLKNDEFAMFALDGEKEVVMTAELFGCEWKAKIDVINHDG